MGPTGWVTPGRTAATGGVGESLPAVCLRPYRVVGYNTSGLERFCSRGEPFHCPGRQMVGGLPLLPAHRKFDAPPARGARNRRRPDTHTGHAVGPGRREGDLPAAGRQRIPGINTAGRTPTGRGSDVK